MTLSNSNPARCSRYRTLRSTSVSGYWLAALLLLAAHPRFVARGVVIFGAAGADPNHNTTAPGGALAGSGWQYAGLYQGQFLAYPIAPNYFVAARHTGGGVGSGFSFQATPYTIDATFDPPTSSDLRIFHVTTPFPTWAPLYTAADELGKDFVVFGNGNARGAEVNVTGASPTDLRGWLWGSSDSRTRWGQNTVEDIDGTGPTSLLVSYFDRGGFTEEATVSAGDSSGGVFINDGGVWKLAGLVLGVQANFSIPPGPGFNAAIFDAGGLRYLPTSFDVPDGALDVPAAWAATRISSNLDWIFTVVPEASPGPWVLLAGTGLIAARMALRRR